MNKLEAARLLTIASGFDRFVRADELTTTAWTLALRDLPYDRAEAAVVAHYCGPDAHKQLMPADIIRAVQFEARLTKPQIEEDVRAAKAYGLIESSWPYAQALPEDVRAVLFQRRAGKRQEAIERGDPEPISRDDFARMEIEFGGAA